jgi:ribosome-binding protein aMBF1 (putative translation factor)
MVHSTPIQTKRALKRQVNRDKEMLNEDLESKKIENEILSTSDLAKLIFDESLLESIEHYEALKAENSVLWTKCSDCSND